MSLQASGNGSEFSSAPYPLLGFLSACFSPQALRPDVRFDDFEERHFLTAPKNLSLPEPGREQPACEILLQLAVVVEDLRVKVCRLAPAPELFRDTKHKSMNFFQRMAASGRSDDRQSTSRLIERCEALGAVVAAARMRLYIEYGRR